jgi:ATP-dependent DNA ligase
VVRRGSQARLWTRNRIDISDLFPDIVAAAETQLPARAKAAQLPAAFDLLAIGGIDLRTQRWTVRRNRLEQLAAGWAPPLQLTPVTSDVDEAKEWFDVLPAAMGVEGSSSMARPPATPLAAGTPGSR